MSLIDITFSNKDTPEEVDGQYQFHLDDTVTGVKRYVQFKLANGKPVKLYHDHLILDKNDNTLKDLGIVMGDNLEYEIIEKIGGKKRKSKGKRKSKRRNKSKRKSSTRNTKRK